MRASAWGRKSMLIDLVAFQVDAPLKDTREREDAMNIAVKVDANAEAATA